MCPEGVWGDDRTFVSRDQTPFVAEGQEGPSGFEGKGESILWLGGGLLTGSALADAEYFFK